MRHWKEQDDKHGILSNAPPVVREMRDKALANLVGNETTGKESRMELWNSSGDATAVAAAAASSMVPRTGWTPKGAEEQEAYRLKHEIPLKPDYLLKKEDDLPYYSRYTYVKVGLADAIFWTGVGILLRIVIFVALIPTGGVAFFILAAVETTMAVTAASKTLNNLKEGNTEEGTVFGLSEGMIDLGGIVVAGGMGIGSLSKSLFRSGVKALDEKALASVIKELEEQGFSKKGATWTTEEIAEAQANLSRAYDYRKVKIQTNNGGETLATTKEIRQFKKKWSQFGIPVKVDIKGKILKEGYEAAFDFGNGQIFIRKNPTLVNLYHEGYHAEQWLDIGKDAYMNLSRLEREEYVFMQIMKNRYLFDQASLDHSLNYIEGLRRKFK